MKTVPPYHSQQRLGNQPCSTPSIFGCCGLLLGMVVRIEVTPTSTNPFAALEIEKIFLEYWICMPVCLSMKRSIMYVLLRRLNSLERFQRLDPSLRCTGKPLYESINACPGKTSIVLDGTISTDGNDGFIDRYLLLKCSIPSIGL